MSTRSVSLLFCALALLAALLVGGCGGTSDASDSNAAFLSRIHFIQKADDVCANSRERMTIDAGAYLKKHINVKNPTEAMYAEIVEIDLVPNVEWELKELREIKPPDGDEDRVEEVLRAIEGSIEDAKADPRKAVVTGTLLFGQSTKLANEYGFQTCGLPS